MYTTTGAPATDFYNFWRLLGWTWCLMLLRTLLIFHRGLNTINLSTLNTFQQFMLFMLIILGSAIFVSAFVVHIRKKAFEKRFKSVIERQRRKREHKKSSWGSLSPISRFLK